MQRGRRQACFGTSREAPFGTSDQHNPGLWPPCSCLLSLCYFAAEVAVNVDFFPQVSFLSSVFNFVLTQTEYLLFL